MTSFFDDIPQPSDAQLAGFTAFTFNNVVIQPTVLADTSDTFSNLIGMYHATTTENGDFYLMWLEYEPWFSTDGNYAKTDAGGNAQTNGASETWCSYALQQINSTWRVYFQMGDEYSDWEGMKYTFTEGSAIATGEANK